MENKNSVYVENLQKNVCLSQGLTLLEALQEAKVPIFSSCGGQGTCGTCVVEVKEGGPLLPPREEIENEIATARKFAANERLSCQIPCRDKLKIRIENYRFS